MPPFRLAVITLVADWALAGGTLAPPSAIAALAGTAALVAARERRHPAMALAAGIMIGTATAGVALLPVLLGTAIARRAVKETLPPFAAAAAIAALLIGRSPTTDASLTTITPADLHLLLLATACGVTAWVAASCAARPPLPRELDAAALLATLAVSLLAPIGVEALALAAALALGGARLTLSPIARAANDVPPRVANA